MIDAAMKVLITGARGFMGRYLVDDLVAAGHDVTGVGRAEIDLVGGDVDALLDRTRPDTVVHLAARVGRLPGEDDPARTIAQNAIATTRVAKACARAGARLAYASSSEIYGDHGDEIATEETLPRLPHNMYGLSKRWGEEAAALYAPQGLSILRITMTYGPGLLPGRQASAVTNMLASALRRTPIGVHHGATRSWCWVGDTAAAIRTLLEAHADGIWNVGRDDDEEPIRVTAERACALAGAPLELIEEVAAPPAQTVVKRLSTRKLAATGWLPATTLEDGMARTLAWLRETRDSWE